MKSGEVEVIRGSGNAFRDLGHESADVAQLKAILAAEIIKTSVTPFLDDLPWIV